MNSTEIILKNAKETVRALAGVSDESLNLALLAMADAVEADVETILEANAADIEAARGNISEVMIDRLRLTRERIHAMAKGIREVTALPSPLGKVLRQVVRPNGLVIDKVSVPMGVIAIIYESRPNVTSDAAALAIKSGNVAILIPHPRRSLWLCGAVLPRWDCPRTAFSLSPTQAVRARPLL